MKRLITRMAIAFALLTAAAAAGFAEGAAEQTAAGTGERIEVTLGSINIGAAFPEGADDPMRDYIEDRFNVTLTPKDYNWGDLETKLNTWAASATLPDVFFIAHVGTGRYFQWIEDGVVRALPEDLSAWPDLEWTVENTGVREYDVDGRTYALPRGGARVLPSSYPELADSNLSWGGRTLFVRKDWMEQLGIDDPQTAEEFIEMCVRFATEDPDGNGQDDTMGFTLRAIWPFHSQTFGYGYTDGSWIEVDGEYHLGHTTHAAFELFSFLRELYQRGGLDPDFVLNTGGFDSVDLFATDKAGLTNFQSVPVHYNGFVERWNQFNPDRPFFDHVKVLRPFPVDGYDFHAIGRAGETSFWSESYVAGTVDDEKMGRILDLYDWLYSPEGIMTVMFGHEGQDYRMDGADIVPLKTDDQGNMLLASDLYPIMSAAGGFSYLANWPEDAVQYVNPKFPAAVRDASIAEIEWFHSVGGMDTPAIPAVQAIDVPEKQNLSIDVGASWARFILDDSGKSNEELYQEMLAEWNANGYQAAVDAITAKAKEMGL